MHHKSNKLKVLLIGTDRADKGGISSVIASYFLLLTDFHFEQLATHRSGKASRKLATLAMAFVRVWRYLLDPDYRVFHIHVASYMSFYRKLPFFVLATMFRKRTVVHVHGGEFGRFYDVYSGWVGKWVIRTVLETAGVVVVLSDSWLPRLRAIAPAARIRILYTPIELPPVSIVPRKPNQLLYLGRVSEAKGFWDLLTALVGVCKVKPDTVLLWGGDGEIERASAAIQSLGLQRQARYLGWVTGKEKRQLLDESALLILPSYHEGLPVIVLEAMAHGLPVICTRVGGVPDVVENNKTGVLLEPGAIDALTAAILNGLNNPAAMQKLAANGRSLVERRMAPAPVAAELIDIYTKLITS